MVDLTTKLGLGDMPSQATAVNNKGQVIGQSGIDPPLLGYAFLWTPAKGVITLRPLSHQPGMSSVAFSINDQGVVVGTSGLAPFQGTAVEWSP
jgi:probable HAF family extracellular repeat protein